MSAAVITVLALLAVLFTFPNFFFVAILANGVPYSVVVILRFAIMDTYVLQTQGEWLIEYDSNGQEIARLQLTKPFDAECISENYGNAIYKLTQGDTRLRFSAQAKGAEYVVTKILGLKWPPLAYHWWPLS